MKKVFLALIIFVVIISGCTKRADNEEKEANVDIRMYLLQQVPFSQNLAELEKLGDVNYNVMLENYVEFSPKSLDKIAFKLGSDIADALVSLKANNKMMLEKIIKTLPDYGEALGVSKQFIMLGVSLKPLINDEKWLEVEHKLNEYQKDIIDELYNMSSYDHVVLVQFGGWIKGLQDVSAALSKDGYDKEATKVLFNKKMIVALEHDINNLRDTDLLNQTHFVKSLVNITEIKQIIFASEDGFFTSEQIDELYKLSKEITENFSK